MTMSDSVRRARSQELVTMLRQEFDGSQYPGDDNLVYDNNSQHTSCADVKSKFSGLRWDNVPDGLIEDTGQDLLFMTPAAQRYFLPTHMIAALTHPDSLRTLHADLIDFLSRLRDFRETFDQLSRPQKGVIADFIRYSIEAFADDLYADEEALTALHSFWLS
jgi:hypothetical protein